MTTGISLVRENTASMQPPRALWVSFPLGRPLGKPGDAAFQIDVIRAALALLERTEGPVLEDYPHDVPAAPADEAQACPISFASDRTDDGSWTARLERELARLRPWYDLSLRRRNGRTLVGVSPSTPDENIRRLGGYLDANELPIDITWLKRAVEDLKACYLEAMTSQPGEHDTAAVHAIFWQDTDLGAAILSLYRDYQASDDNRLKLVARMLAPREAVGMATGPEGGLSSV